MVRPLIVIPVGTSLLNNDGGTRTSGELNDFLAKQQAARNNPCVNTSLQPLVRSLWDGLMQGCALARELGFRRQVPRRGGPRDALPQELSYLALWAEQESFEKADVALLASDSVPGGFCACAIYQVLQDHQDQRPWSRYCVYPPVTVSGLRVDRSSVGDAPYHAFRKEGIPNLVKHIRAGVGQLAPSQLIINISGGYKGAIPYTTLAAHLLAALDQDIEIAIHYLFEDTDHIIELPVYPIGLDLAAWHREWNLMQAAVRRPAYRPHLHHRVRAVFDEEEHQSEPWKVEGSVPHLLHQQYQAQRDKDPLQIYSERVIEQLVPKQDLRDRLLALMKGVGPLIWYGDRVPMAAEHAARHHHHLLELAQLLLLPLADACVNGDPFLNPEERFVLLAALLLHDCGHTVGALPLSNTETSVPLFTSEVRDLHHFLSWYRLTMGDASETIGWDRNAPLADEVAWLCLYHRARMGWDGIEDTRGRARCPFLGLSVPSPTKLVAWIRKAYSRADFASGIDFPKLVVLLRAIDGLDIQTHRVGPGPSAEVMQATFAAQAEIARSTMKGLLPAADVLLSSQCDGAWVKAKAFCKALSSWLSGDDDSKPRQDEDFWGTREQMASLIANSSADSQRAAAAAWTELARAFDEFCVRDRQFIHFAKHDSVAQITLLPEEDFDQESNWSFIAVLTPSEDYQSKLNCPDFARPYQVDMNGEYTLAKWILREIEAEITPEAQSYLKQVSGRDFRLMPKWNDLE